MGILADTFTGPGLLANVMPLFAQRNNNDAAGAGMLAGLALYLVFLLVVVVLTIAGKWKVFEKAGQPGWAAIIPIYDFYILHTEIAKRKDNTWFILYILGAVIGCLFPLALIALFIVNGEVAKKFGKGGGYGVGLTLLPFIFFPMLGFGSAQYQSSRRSNVDDYDDDEEDDRPRKKKGGDNW